MRHTSFRLTVSPSRYLANTLLAAHLLAIALVVVATVALQWKLALILVAGLSLAYCRHTQHSRDFVFHPDGRVEFLESSSNPSVGAGDTPSSVPSPGELQILDVDNASRLVGALMVVRFRRVSTRRALILLPDSFAHPDDYRRLRIWLKWQGKAVAPDHAQNLLGTQDRI